MHKKVLSMKPYHNNNFLLFILKIMNYIILIPTKHGKMYLKFEVNFSVSVGYISEKKSYET